jgi:DNA-binding beta-propeller fold protein YncE
MLHRTFTVLMALVSALLLSAPLQAQEQGARGRNKRIFVVPRPGPVVIDGKLDDWDLSGQILVYVAPETSAMHSARIALMYDAEALYVSGVVRDPTPLMNRHDPKVDGEKAWDADAFQFRLCLNPKAGYPINEGQANTPDAKPNYQLVHLLLWYFTDEKEPNLQLSYGMTYSPPKASYPKGVVPHDKFQAAYLLTADNKGYTFEYRIPWTTIEARAPLKAGDLVAASLQAHWGTPDGLSIKEAAFDLLATPGYGFLSSGCWGRAIFTARGNLPKELTQEGLPVEPPLPLTFDYELPRDGDVTIALVNDQGQMVRHLLAQAPRKKGNVVERWSGLDDLGKPLPAGAYTWKGIYHDPITTRYLLAVHNSGKPSYATPDGTGAWGADHGHGPTTVCTVGEHVLVAWEGGEGGSSILRSDLHGRKQWGIRTGAQHLATDGRRVFASGGTGFHVCTAVECFSFVDGRPLNFGNGKLNADLPAGGDDKSSTVSGLAFGNGLLYVALAKRNLITLVDPEQGTIQAAWDIPEPRRLAVRPDGSLVVVSKGQVLAVKDGTARPFLTDHLDEPTGIAVDASGAVYVANGGKLQNVSVFAPDGKYLRSIGKEGGRPRVGLFEKNGMLEPGGIAVDQDGKLWVAETLNYPKRLSVWEAKSGRLVNDFFGGSQYSTQVCMDPRHEEEVYCHMTLWKVDLDKGTWYPHSTMWRRSSPDAAPDAYELLRVFTARNGKQFAWGDNSLYLRDGDRFKPIVTGISNVKGQPGWPPYPVFGDRKLFGNGSYFWQDANDDQMLQAGEVTKVQVRVHRPETFQWVDDDLNLWHARGIVHRPVRFEPDGRPVYDFARPERIAAFAGKDLVAASTGGADDFGRLGLSVDPHDRSFYTIQNGCYARWTPDGKRIWDYRVTSSLAPSLSQPIPQPGQVWGAMKNLGVAGEFTGLSTYFGTFHLFTRDGLYVARLFKDQRLGESGPDVLNTETGCGQLILTEKSGRYLLLGGDTDGRVTEVLGLGSVRPLQGSYALTPKDVETVQLAQAEFAGLKARAQRLSIVRGRAALNVAAGVTKVVDGKRGFTARAAYDTQNLYVSYDVESPFELVNTIPEPQILFKGGNLLDIQLATDPAADPKRTKPAPGDVRLLVTRQQGKPLAVIYRPKVKGFTGQALVLKSPTGQEPFDAIEVSDQVRLEHKKTPAGFSALVTIPLGALGWVPQPSSMVRLDLGYLFGNATGNQCAQRAYWANAGPTAGIIGDVPSESRLEPAQWGTATVE